MNTYQAIMRAANYIERHPQEFNFRTTSIPDGPGCGSPGCALGWIAVFSDPEASYYKSPGYPKDYRSIGAIAENALNCCSSLDFYFRMDAIISKWREDPTACALGLRLYAEKYHGQEKPSLVSPPDWNAIAAKWIVGDDVRSQEVAA